MYFVNSVYSTYFADFGILVFRYSGTPVFRYSGILVFRNSGTPAFR